MPGVCSTGEKQSECLFTDGRRAGKQNRRWLGFSVLSFPEKQGSLAERTFSKKTVRALSLNLRDFGKSFNFIWASVFSLES